jgi:hypothetical protein
LSMANAHMFLAEPVPIQGNAIKDPLDPSGSNFPCHGAALPTSGGQKLVAGETFPLKLELADGANTAVHGGGSCQLAILSDTTNAADPASWNVIYSIEGGCPSNTKGNLLAPLSAVACETNDQGDCVHSWDIPMPKGVKSGNAILSWTWFNTIGNREMYQNCVNVDITGGSGDGTFPPLFVANLASVNSLKTTEESDVLFPQPGEFVTTMSATNGHNYPKATLGAGEAPGGYTAPKATSVPAYSAPAPSVPAYSAPASSAPAYSAPTQIASQIQSYDNQKQKQTYTTFATATSAVAAPSSEAPAPAPTGYSDAGSNNASSSSSTPCSEEGALICIGSDSFGICDQGAAVKQALAKGTACTNGVISGMSRFRRHIHGVHKH